MQASLTLWVGFNVAILLLLALDLFFHRKDHVISIKEAGLWTLFWIGLALGFNIFIYYWAGKELALAFFTGYLLEKSLSVDNLFVFILIFSYFQTPAKLLHRVLFWGVLGAIIFRAIFIFLGITLVTQFHWLLYLFGIFLIITGIRFAFQKDREVHPEKNLILKGIRKIIPISDTYEEHHFFVKKGIQWIATPLFVVLVAIETTDILFALDSIPLILGITLDPFIVYTSNILAILGLRSLFFILAHIMKLFHYLHYGLATLLVFIGLKMVFADLLHLPIYITLFVVVMVLVISIFLSLLIPKKNY